MIGKSGATSMAKTNNAGMGSDRSGAASPEELLLQVVFCPNRRVEGAAIPLAVGQTFVVGRGEVADPDKMIEDERFDLPDDRVSREHTRFGRAPETGIPTLQDLRSKNGTWLNGITVSRSPLARCDLVRIGDSLLVCRGPGEPVAADGDSGAKKPPLRERKEEIPLLWQNYIGLSGTISGSRDASNLEALPLYP